MLTSTKYALRPICPRSHHNYVGLFLTLSCNLSCPWCINLHTEARRSEQARRPKMNASQWIEAANRMVLRDDLPLTLQGGEPTLHRGFFTLVNEVRPDIKMDLMTNLMFDIDAFVDNVPVWRFTREAPYAPIRVSYHPGQNDIDELVARTLKLQDAGFRIGIYAIDHPSQEINDHIKKTQERCLKIGIDFRLKEFLGVYDGASYGTFKYPECVCADHLRQCQCRTSEIIVDPAGFVFRCHSDLYKHRQPIAHILDQEFTEASIDTFRSCEAYGDCNPCDVKIKTNRFQVSGHTSVEIMNVHPQCRSGRQDRRLSNASHPAERV